MVAKVTSAKKRALEAKADTAEVAALLEVLAASHKATLAALDRAEREVAATRAYFGAKRPAPAQP